jgi:NTP pyrophosphatase (non-canonical NTP hydrolase)
MLRSALLGFRTECAWERFHTPSNPAASGVIAAAEVREHFQWLRDGETLTERQRAELGKELADVFIYLPLLSNDQGVDLLSAAAATTHEDADRSPIAEARRKAWSNKPERDERPRHTTPTAAPDRCQAGGQPLSPDAGAGCGRCRSLARAARGPPVALVRRYRA